MTRVLTAASARFHELDTLMEYLQRTDLTAATCEPDARGYVAIVEYIADHREMLLATLHIEHPISDLGTWLGAFNQFADARRDAGVTAQRIHQPVDDDRYIVVQLDFDTVDAAEQFKGFLESVVWQSRDLSPGLMGSPTARVLREAQVAM